ncbi:MAG TPA: ferrochelatase [Sporichthyaceae bacterium]|nr:ferrochelatase [Sporichthyaceae bacterium]
MAAGRIIAVHRDPGTARYDAFLLVSFGGPENPAEVLPFLRNVTRGRDVPEARLAAVAEHYQHFGGRSPINDQCRALCDALRTQFAADGLELPVYWGNRNWQPFLADTLRTMADDGVRHALALLTSAYNSYSGCRQYREDLAAARAEVGPDAPTVDRIRAYFNHPGFVRPQIAGVRAALDALPATLRADARLVFTTHSIPVRMAASSGPLGDAYVTQHHEVARLVAEGVAAATGRAHDWQLVYQSRSGPPSVPWLEPDVGDHLRALAAAGVSAVVVAPIGFVSDHLEVAYDLDVEARAVAAELGLAFVRAATVGTSPEFVAGIRELVCERLTGARQRAVLGRLGADHDVCPVHCCPNPRAALPTVGGVGDQ